MPFRSGAASAERRCGCRRHHAPPLDALGQLRQSVSQRDNLPTCRIRKAQRQLPWMPTAERQRQQRRRAAAAGGGSGGPERQVTSDLDRSQIAYAISIYTKLSALVQSASSPSPQRHRLPCSTPLLASKALIMTKTVDAEVCRCGQAPPPPPPPQQPAINRLAGAPDLCPRPRSVANVQPTAEAHI